ncbi:Piwi-domain-containing protein [Xylariaceae sp. FL1019]|nr:Piwi-domain-containing protein [Xylariaceae sp. FL1019]
MSSHGGSQAGGRSSRPSSRPGSQAGSPSKPPVQASTGKPSGSAGNEEKKVLTPAQRIGKLIDLPADAYLTTTDKHRFAARPGYNTVGKQIKVQLNVFPILSYNKQDVYQYDIALSPSNDTTTRAKYKKCFMDQAVQEFLAKSGAVWLYDGHKLAWSSKPVREARMKVDLDRNHPNLNKRNSKGVYYVMIRPTTKVRLDYLEGYLKGTVAWDEQVLQAMNFLDHCMRQGPSERMLAIKRNFYSRVTTPFHLDGMPEYVLVRTGYYSAFRLSESIKSGGTGLMINVDVANTAFWKSSTLVDLAAKLLGEYNNLKQKMEVRDMIAGLRPKEKNGVLVMSDYFRLLEKLKAIKFTVTHRNKQTNDRVYTCKYLLFEQQYGKAGCTAHTKKFDWKQTNDTTRTVTIFQYFREKYNITLRWPDLPLVHTDKFGTFPMELCTIADDQRYPYKLTGKQTTAMIKHAVTEPPKRKRGVMAGIQALDVQNDRYLRAFGINIDTNMKVTNARLLKNPEIVFGGAGAAARVNPRMTGRWDIKNARKFLQPNTRELISWGFIVCGDACSKDQAESFASRFVKIYRGHGGRIKNNPVVVQVAYSIGDYSHYCQTGREEIWKKHGSRPDFIFIIVPDNNSLTYMRVKKNMDCRYITPSQVLVGGSSGKWSDQFCSNVAMKVNAKLGGVTCKIAPASSAYADTAFLTPTMIIGADVSHGGAGSKAPSMAALSVSMDKLATRYSGACETNSYNTEIIGADIMKGMLKNHFRHWKTSNNCDPKHIYYFRDGVDEGSFDTVLKQEIGAIEELMKKMEMPSPKFTVIIATKRHHIRFFPKEGDRETADRNGNPFPGTLVERDCTHPQHWDFYLCSHAAIKGTARPVHYQVIRDDAKVSPDSLQKMIYEHCYQYCRATTPVSLFPAVYYAHLISNRARSHENIFSSQRELPNVKAGFPVGKAGSAVYTDAHLHVPGKDAPPLIKMAGGSDAIGEYGNDRQFFNTTMWYV